MATIVLKGARINKIGASKFGGRYMAVKHNDFDGFLDVKDDGLDLDGLEGSFADIQYEEKGKKKLVVKVRPAGGSGGGSSTNASAQAGRAPAASNGGGYNSDPRGASIVMQHAQKVSAELVKLFVDKGVIKLGAQPKQQAQIMELFDELATHLFVRAQGDGLQKIVDEQAALLAELDPANDADADSPEPAKAGGTVADDFEDDFDAN